MVWPYVATNLYVGYNEQGSREPSVFLPVGSQWTTSIHFRVHSLEKEEPNKARGFDPIVNFAA